MGILTDYYFKPTPKKFRILGDSLLIISVGLGASIVNIHSISEDAKGLIIFSVDLLGILGKLITNFAIEEGDKDMLPPLL